MRFETTIDSLNFAWGQVVVAFWARYPNPFAGHVLTEDVLRRELRPDGSLYTCRLLMKTNSIPKWGQYLMPANRVPIIEESIVDAETKTLTTYCRNISHKGLMETVEKVVYTSRENEDGNPITQCHKMFWVSSQWYAPTGSLIERFGIQRWVKNIAKTRRGLEHVIGQIYEDGPEEAPSSSSSAASATAATPATPAVPLMHPFIAEKRRMLKEKAAAMGQKAKVRLQHPIGQAKEKYERTRDNAKVTLGNAQDNLKDKLGKREAES